MALSKQELSNAFELLKNCTTMNAQGAQVLLQTMQRIQQEMQEGEKEIKVVEPKEAKK